jgi:hypothetical protein
MSFKLTIPFDLGRGLARISNIKALFTTLSDAFDEATGHTHDGSAGQGAPIADTTALGNADADAYKPGFISADADGRALFAAKAVTAAKIDVPTEDPEDGVTIWNDAGVLKVASSGE